jgi:hypothetical protein
MTHAVLRFALMTADSLRDGLMSADDVMHAVRRPPEVKGGDGDLFIIVASDGVWEFTESDEACRIVEKYTSATEACSQVMI